MRIVAIIGARPQFIKAAAVSRAIRAHNAEGGRPIQEVLVHTGQHYDYGMSQVFFDELDIPQPDYNLGIGSLPHGAQTGRMLERIEGVLQKEAPDWVLVYGDTNSTLAGALAAAKLHIPVAHVEAGLRSFNRRMPEEVNRVLTDHISDLLLAPTETAVANLQREGLPPERIHQVGDVMYDAALYHAAQAEERSDILQRLALTPRSYVLATVHRAENTDDAGRLTAIFEALCVVAEETPVVLPLHPRTRGALARAGLLETVEQHCRVIDPVGYLDMILLEKNARVIATDSGGVQKEAYFYSVPCVTLREETEWVETVEAGWNVLVGADKGDLIRSVQHARRSVDVAQRSIYGDGNASRHCVHRLLG
ncbi:MAG TPA: UDP-N-acetylglucosamine 2-epimerase (non-hydrolyzing) [Chloroflexi bacterium]|nr:UDP-N-acetylglucosamine 2-epimerase (non-hydrolyzing) [Chloroflexota bacterium]